MFFVASGLTTQLVAIDRLLWVLALPTMAALSGSDNVGEGGSIDQIAPSRMYIDPITKRRRQLMHDAGRAELIEAACA
jgi:hypothetical protein